MLNHPEKIIIIEDQTEYAQKLKQRAKKHRLLADCFDNLDDAMEAIENDIKYRYVILDDKCYLTARKLNDPQSSFMIKAMKELQELEFEHDRIVPYCINAVEQEQTKELFDGDAKVFEKHSVDSEILMWQHVSKEVEQLPYTQLREKYHEAFAFVEKHLTALEEKALYMLLENMERKDAPSIVASLSIIRRMLEAVIDAAWLIMQRRYTSLRMPSDQHRSRTKMVADVLFQRKHIPYHIKSSVHNVYTNCSRYGTHTSGVGDVSNLPSHNYVKALLFLLMDIMAYFDKKGQV